VNPRAIEFTAAERRDHNGADETGGRKQELDESAKGQAKSARPNRGLRRESVGSGQAGATGGRVACEAGFDVTYLRSRSEGRAGSTVDADLESDSHAFSLVPIIPNKPAADAGPHAGTLGGTVVYKGSYAAHPFQRR